jgi:hypothetical protein
MKETLEVDNIGNFLAGEFFLQNILDLVRNTPLDCKTAVLAEKRFITH